MSPLRLAILGLSRRKVSSLIAILSIAISVGTSGILLRTFLLTSGRFSQMAVGPDAIIGAKSSDIDILLGALNLEGDYPGFIPQKLFESLRAGVKVQFEDGAQSEPHYLKAVIPFLYFGQMDGFRMIATDKVFFHPTEASPHVALVSGVMWNKPLSLVVGNRMAEKLRLHLGQTIPVKLWYKNDTTNKLPDGTVEQPVSFEIVGILAPQGNAYDFAAFGNIDTIQNLFSQVPLGDSSIWQGQVLNYFLIYMDPAGHSQLESLINKRTVGQVAWVTATRTRLENLTGTGRYLGFAISALVLFLGGLGVTSMMSTRFEAMNMQMAVVRAIGFSRREIAVWLLCEGLIIGVLACVIGATIDASLFGSLRTSLGPSIPNVEWLPTSIWQSWEIWVIAIFASAAALVLPLVSVLRQDVHDQLKSL